MFGRHRIGWQNDKIERNGTVTAGDACEQFGIFPASRKLLFTEGERFTVHDGFTDLLRIFLIYRKIELYDAISAGNSHERVAVNA